MAIGTMLLGLLENSPRHGYELKQTYDRQFGYGRIINFGQIYATLKRLERDGHVTARKVESDQGPDRKLYAITREGVAHLERWLNEPESPTAYLQNVLYAKVMLALASDRPAERYLDAQSAALLRRMRALTTLKNSTFIAEVALADYAIFHLEADVRWMDLTQNRLTLLRKELCG